MDRLKEREASRKRRASSRVVATVGSIGGEQIDTVRFTGSLRKRPAGWRGLESSSDHIQERSRGDARERCWRCASRSPDTRRTHRKQIPRVTLANLFVGYGVIILRLDWRAGDRRARGVAQGV